MTGDLVLEEAAGEILRGSAEGGEGKSSAVPGEIADRDCPDEGVSGEVSGLAVVVDTTEGASEMREMRRITRRSFSIFSISRVTSPILLGRDFESLNPPPKVGDDKLPVLEGRLRDFFFGSTPACRVV